MAHKKQIVSKNDRKGSQFLRWFGPILDALRFLGGSGKPNEVTAAIAKAEKIPDEKLNEVLKSGDLRFNNQVAFARFYLVKEGLLDSSERGVWSLTEKGWKTHLSIEEANEIFVRWVKIFDQKRKEQKASATDESIPDDESDSTSYRGKLLDKIKSLPPDGFERLTQRLLREAGFVQVTVTGKSGDGGIDGFGILEINPLVSFKVLFQCKRYAGGVTPSQVRDFRGAMDGRTDKGIIVTTGTFSTEARKEATRDGAVPIELIDGTKLVGMFEQLELGLKPIKTYEVDEPFFSEFETTKTIR